MNLRHRFWLGLAVMLLLFVSFGVYAVVSAGSALVLAKESELVAFAGALGDSVEHRIHEQVHFLEYLGLQQFSVVRDLSEANARGPEQDGARRLALEREWQEGGGIRVSAEGAGVSRRLQGLAVFLDERQGFPVFTEIFVTDVHGRVVGMTGGTSDYFQDDEAWWLDAMRFGIVAESFEFDESSNSYGLLAAVRLDDEFGRPLGVVKGVLNLAGVVKQVERDKVGSDSELLLFDSAGRLLFSSRGGFELFGRDFSESELVNNVRGSDGFFALAGEAELPYVAYHRLTSAGYPGRWFDWTFVFRGEGDVIFAQVNQMVLSAVLFLLLVAGVVLVLGVFVSRRITVPIEQLAEVLEQTSTGSGNTEIPSVLKDSQDEIGRLARSFDRMLYSMRMATRKSPPKGQD